MISGIGRRYGWHFIAIEPRIIIWFNCPAATCDRAGSIQNERLTRFQMNRVVLILRCHGKGTTQRFEWFFFGTFGSIIATYCVDIKIQQVI